MSDEMPAFSSNGIAKMACAWRPDLLLSGQAHQPRSGVPEARA
jgi:hypothetical protein